MLILNDKFQARKEETERKRIEALEKKKEREQLAAQEDAEFKAQAAKKGGQTQKMSRAHIREETERREAVARGRNPEAPKTHLTSPLEENINRIDTDAVEARTVDEALNVLRYVQQTWEIKESRKERPSTALGNSAAFSVKTRL